MLEQCDQRRYVDVSWMWNLEEAEGAGAEEGRAKEHCGWAALRATAILRQNLIAGNTEKVPYLLL